MTLKGRLIVVGLPGLLILYAGTISTWELLLMLVLVGVLVLWVHCTLHDILKKVPRFLSFFVAGFYLVAVTNYLMYLGLYVIARVSIGIIIALCRRRPDSPSEAEPGTSLNLIFWVAAVYCVGAICYVLALSYKREAGLMYQQLANAMKAALSWFRGVPQQVPYDPVADFIKNGTVPCGLSCPITGTIMRNPVSTSTGHTYECSAIAAWLDGHETDPVTTLRLNSKVLTRNWVAKEFCSDFEAKVRAVDPSTDKFPPVDMKIPERFAPPPQAPLRHEPEPAFAQENFANEEVGEIRDLIADICKDVTELFLRTRVRLGKWFEMTMPSG